MGKAYLILDGTSRVVTTHMWGGETDAACPIAAPVEGRCVEVDAGSLELILSLTIGGQSVVVMNDEVLVDGEKIATLQNGTVVLE